MTAHPRRRLRAIARWALRALLGLLIVLAGTGLLVATALSTVTGKQLLSSWVVARINQQLPGQVAVHRLETFTLSEVVLAGLSLKTRGGDEVVTVEKVRLDLELWPLLHGQVVASALAIERATLDLRFPNDPEHGLVPALVKPTHGKKAGALPNVRVEHLALRGVEVRLPEASALGLVVLRDLALDAQVSLGPHSALDIARLDTELWRDQAKLGELTLRAQLNDAGQPSRIELGSSLGDAQVQLGVTGTYTKQADVRRVPIELALRLSEVTAAKVAWVFGRPGVGQAFLGSIDAELRGAGSLADLGATATLRTRGGLVSVISRLQDLAELELTLRTERLGLTELFDGAPDLRLTTTSVLSAKPLGARPFAELELRSTGALDDAALPRLNLQAERVGDGLRAIDLRLEDASSSLRVNGAASLSGETELALDADVDAASLLPLAKALGKPLPDTSGRVRGTLSWLRRASGQVTSSGRVEGAGMFRRQPWRLEMQPADISATGLALPHVALTFAGQRLTLRGQYSPAASELEVELLSADLKRLLQPFDVPGNLQGHLSARLLARGSIERPRLRLQLQGDRIRRAGGPALDVRITGELDARVGTFEVDGELDEHTNDEEADPAEHTLVLGARSRFEPGATLWDNWLRGEHQAKLEISHLTNEVASALLGRELPESFDVHAELSLLAARGALQTRLGLSDQHGALLSLYGELAWPASVELAPGLVAWLAREPTLEQATKVLDRAAWKLNLELAPRALQHVPIPIDVAGISAAIVSGRMDVTRSPSREPEGTLYAEVRDLRTAQGSAECSSGALVARGRVELHEGSFRAEVSASDRERQLLLVAGQGRLELLPLLRGELPRVAGVDITADSRRLPLGALPFMCERLEGSLSARARLRDISAPEARAQVDLQIEGFSAGSDEALDVTAALEGDATHVSAKGQLTASGKTSTWTAELPLARSGGRLGLDPERALDVSLRLDHLPVGPFAPSPGAISYASGSVSGTLTARGKATAPDLAGRLTLNDVGFTATAIAQPLSDIKGELVLGNGELLVKSLSARDAGGELALRGSLAIRSLQSFDGVLDLVARDFPLRQAGQVVATTSAKARIRPSVRANETTVDVELASFDTWLEGGKIQKGLALDKHPDLVIDGALSESEEVPKAGQRSSRAHGVAPGARKVVVNIEADEGFRIRRGDFSIKLSTELSVTVEERGTGHEPKLTVDGRITFESGNLDLLGRTFEIEPGGTLRFSGPPVPTVDLTASYVDRRSDDTVVAHVSGSASSPKVEFSINGEKATPAEALQAIYGAPDSSTEDEDDVEGQAEVEAQQLLAALTAGILTAGLRKRFGGITPIIGFAPTAKEGTEQVRAGFELDSLIPSFLRGIVTGIYVEGSVSSEQEEEAAGGEETQLETLIELHFPHDLVTIGRHGPGATWSLDLGWRPGPF